jgi:hypothetical protein
VEYFNYVGGMTSNGARWTREIKSRIAMARAALIQNGDSFYQQTGPNFKEEMLKCYIRSRAFYGAEASILRKVDEKALESFEVLEKDGKLDR